VENLADLVVTCIDHPGAANQVFLVADAENLSTADLLRRLAVASGRSGVMLPFPEVLIRVTCQLLGKSAIYQRLCLSLQLDTSHTQQQLEWHPPYTVDEGFTQTAQSYLNSKG
jgi:nucleoside-diphosphate-sugar epimerase